MSNGLVQLAPREAMEMWLDRQRSERAEETVKSYYYRVKQFVEWCEENGYGDNMNGLTTRDIYQFDSWCRAKGLSQSTLNNRLGTLKRFLGFCYKQQAIEESTVKAVEIPPLVKSDRVNEEKLASTRAEEILEDLSTYRYGSREHAMFMLAWHTTARLGAIRSLDVSDVFLKEEDLNRLRHYPEIDDSQFEEIIEFVETPFVYYRHRPDSDTPLKNKNEGQRPVAIEEDVAKILRAYINVNRIEIEDDFGRAALFTTEKGRISKPAIRRIFNIITQPCRFGHECPHGREIEDCEAREHTLEGRCPSSRSPHPIRTGAITDHRDRGWPPEVLAEKANATPEVIREHYDHPDLLKRMESRRKFLDQRGETDV